MSVVLRSKYSGGRPLIDSMLPHNWGERKCADYCLDFLFTDAGSPTDSRCHDLDTLMPIDRPARIPIDTKLWWGRRPVWDGGGNLEISWPGGQWFSCTCPNSILKSIQDAMAAECHAGNISSSENKLCTCLPPEIVFVNVDLLKLTVGL
jgi:hypothetical protein